jgi:DNA replication initiation complex subunit (GINS family)
MEIITYETIRAIHRAEKEEQLQKLPDNFYNSVKNWILHKQKQKDTVSLLEVENTKKLLDDIVSRRERKIVLSALRTIRGELPPKNLTEDEQRFFDNIVNSLKSFRDNIKEQVISYDNVIEEKIEEARKQLNPNGKIILKMIVDMPRFVGPDMNYYGPLRIGEVVSLPKEVANQLVERKVAENFT